MGQREDLLHEVSAITGAPLCKLRKRLQGRTNEDIKKYLETERQVCHALVDKLMELRPRFGRAELEMRTRRELDELIGRLFEEVRSDNLQEQELELLALDACQLA